MAMIKCYECNSEVSEWADTCPNCGAPTEGVIRDAKKRKQGIRNASMLYVLGVVLMLGGCVTGFLMDDYGVGIFWAVIGLTIAVISNIIDPSGT